MIVKIFVKYALQVNRIGDYRCVIRHLFNPTSSINHGQYNFLQNMLFRRQIDQKRVHKIFTLKLETRIMERTKAIKQSREQLSSKKS